MENEREEVIPYFLQEKLISHNPRVVHEFIVRYEKELKENDKTIQKSSK